MKYYFGKLKLLLLAIGIIFVGFVFSWFKIFGILQPDQNFDTQDLTENVSVTPKALFANLTVDYGNGKSTSYENLGITTNETAFSLLKKKMDETGVVIKTKNYDYGTMVESIGGTAASSEYFWGYTVNGQMGSVSADKYVLNPDDSVEWVYTKIQ